MLFVPLPLFATLLLTLLFVRFVLTRDMSLRAHQLFALLVALYTAQSLLSSLRWGYGIAGAAPFAIALAPILPGLAYLAYKALSGQTNKWQLWPLGVVAANWMVFALLPDLTDPMILMTYLGFGGLLLRQAWKGVDHLSLPSINDTREILIAMVLTGVTLIASGLTDVYVIYDFIRNEGQTAGLIITFVQTGFVLVIGIAGAFGKATTHGATEVPAPVTKALPTGEDADIIARLEELFTVQQLHRSEDLSLRRLSRRLGLPDRQVSQAINRQKEVSVSQYVNTFRIQDACEMLKATNNSVLDVSLAVGFATKSNFNREFLRVTGQSPSEWRKAN